MEKFGELVRELLQQMGISQAEIAKRMGLSPQAIATMLSDRNSPTLSRVKQVAEALAVPSFYLLMNKAERLKWDQLQAGRCEDSSVYLETIKNLNSRIKDLEERIIPHPKKVERLGNPNKR